MTCTFFGHRTVSDDIEQSLRSTIINLIENNKVDLFYVGNQGSFDSMVRHVLKELSNIYQIKYYVVLAYMPEKRMYYDTSDYSDTIILEGYEIIPKRFAIPYRNKWMISKSDYVVTYVTHDIGSGAAKFKSLAERCGKEVINLYHSGKNETK